MKQILHGAYGAFRSAGAVSVPQEKERLAGSADAGAARQRNHMKRLLLRIDRGKNETVRTSFPFLTGSNKERIFRSPRFPRLLRRIRSRPPGQKSERSVHDSRADRQKEQNDKEQFFIANTGFLHDFVFSVCAASTRKFRPVRVSS